MKSRTIAFISVFAGILLFGVSMVMIGSVLPLLKLRLGLSDIVAGGLFSILPFGLLIGSISLDLSAINMVIDGYYQQPVCY